MCFRLRRIGDLMAVKEGRGPQQHGGVEEEGAERRVGLVRGSGT
jgi:hypothetical protein